MTDGPTVQEFTAATTGNCATFTAVDPPDTDGADGATLRYSPQPLPLPSGSPKVQSLLEEKQYDFGSQPRKAFKAYTDIDNKHIMIIMANDSGYDLDSEIFSTAVANFVQRASG